MQRMLLTTDLHQHRGKWEELVHAAERERPAFILIAGGILPKDGGFTRQREFFPRLRQMLRSIREISGNRAAPRLCSTAHRASPGQYLL